MQVIATESRATASCSRWNVLPARQPRHGRFQRRQPFAMTLQPLGKLRGHRQWVNSGQDSGGRGPVWVLRLFVALNEVFRGGLEAAIQVDQTMTLARPGPKHIADSHPQATRCIGSIGSSTKILDLFLGDVIDFGELQHGLNVEPFVSLLLPTAIVNEPADEVRALAILLTILLGDNGPTLGPFLFPLGFCVLLRHFNLLSCLP